MSKIQLKAKKKSIYALFSGSNKQYIIPPYQRSYCWGIKNTRRLFDDITGAYINNKNEGVFLGSIFISKCTEIRNRAEVIDGQNRLTTLVLLIKALLGFDGDNLYLKNAIKIPNLNHDKGEKLRLITTVFMRKDSKYLNRALLLDLSKRHRRKAGGDLFRSNMLYLHENVEKFSKYNNIKDFIDFLMFDVCFLSIEIKDKCPDKSRENAFKIFETMNGKGINVRESDLIKGKIYSIALNKLKHDEFIEKWMLIERTCSSFDGGLDSVFSEYAIKNGSGYSVYQSGNLRRFFLESKDSPIFRKEYNEVIDDLSEIANELYSESLYGDN